MTGPGVASDCPVAGAEASLRRLASWPPNGVLHEKYRDALKGLLKSLSKDFA